MNMIMINTSFMRQSTHSLDVLLLHARFFKHRVKESKSCISLLENKGESNSSTTIRNALMLCGNFFPDNIDPTPANATCNMSSRPEHIINVHSQQMTLVCA